LSEPALGIISIIRSEPFHKIYFMTKEWTTSHNSNMSIEWTTSHDSNMSIEWAKNTDIYQSHKANQWWRENRDIRVNQLIWVYQ
jgi:hypothetical protein